MPSYATGALSVSEFVRSVVLSEANAAISRDAGVMFEEETIG